METDAGTNAFELVDAAYPGAAWIGSEVVLRCANWQYDKGTMGGPGLQQNGWSVASTLNLEFLFDGTTAGWGYFLQKRLEDCDAPGEWHANGQDLRVMSLNGGAPGTITAAVWDKGLDFQNADNCTVSDIRFERYIITGLYSEDCNSLHVTGCEFVECTQGIGEDPPPPGNANCQYTNNLFQRCYTLGLLSSGSNALIQGNDFVDIGLEIGMGAGVYGDYRGLLSTGPGVTITENTFTNIGYSAMDVNGSGTISRNYINGALKILNDGGGVAVDDCDGLVIEDNIVSGLSTNFPNNAVSTSKAYYAYQDISFGIYFGFFSVKNTRVEGNTVTGCSAGTHIDHTHFSENNRILRNTFFDNAVQLSVSDASNEQTDDDCSCPVYKPSYNDQYSGNICYSIKEDQRCLQVLNAHADSWAGAEPLVDFGTFKDNYYFNPFSDLPVWIVPKYVTYDDQPVPMTLERWRAWFDEDVNSHASPVHDVEPNDFTLNTGVTVTVTDPDFSSSGSGWSSSNGAAPTFPNQNGNIFMRTSGAEIVQNLSAFRNVQRPADEGYWLFEFDARSDMPGALEVFLLNRFTYLPAPTGGFVDVGPEWRHYSVPILLPGVSPDPNCPIEWIYSHFRDPEFLVGATQRTFDIDNVAVAKQDGTLEPTDEHRLFIYMDDGILAMMRTTRTISRPTRSPPAVGVTCTATSTPVPLPCLRTLAVSFYTSSTPASTSPQATSLAATRYGPTTRTSRAWLRCQPAHRSPSTGPRSALPTAASMQILSHAWRCTREVC
ncbi:MAG: right-handed parallel beta-helix repeat-containing protein [Flavobacteriales bacterium]|nr:MAG: right-handed parallel beta-helix repeat-containing protein [Flavobacteriales bacterium]